MKARMAFDTLAYANRLKIAGMDAKIAETQAEANADMLANLLDSDLATKADLSLLESRLTALIHEKIADLDKKFSEKFDNLEKRISNLESRISNLESRISNLENRLDTLEHRLFIKLGTLMVTCTGVMTVILKFLH